MQAQSYGRTLEMVSPVGLSWEENNFSDCTVYVLSWLKTGTNIIMAECKYNYAKDLFKFCGEKTVTVTSEDWRSPYW
jgi:hypothetical protein